jgi:GH24 family phage-related lysozyme (muramidase)
MAPDQTAAILLACRLIQQFEGLRLDAYKDVAGLWTVGYGARFLPDGSAVTEGCAISAAIADALLAANIAALADQVAGALRVEATAGQTAALISFAYNLGFGALRNSTLLRLFNAGNAAAAAEQFGAWVHAGGQVVEDLVNRRRSERAVFLGDISQFPQET